MNSATNRSMRRSLTWKDIEGIYAIVSQKALKIVNDDQQEHEPILLGILMSEDEPGSPEVISPVDPQLVRVCMRSRMGKDVLTELSRQIINVRAVDLTVLISEAWMVVVQAPEGTTRATELLDQPPSEHPDRQDCLLITINTPLGTFGGVNPIATAADGTRRLDIKPLFEAEMTGAMGMSAEETKGHQA